MWHVTWRDVAVSTRLVNQSIPQLTEHLIGAYLLTYLPYTPTKLLRSEKISDYLSMLRRFDKNIEQSVAHRIAE